MEVNAERFDKALHEIPVFIKELDDVIDRAQKIRKEFIDLRQHLLTSIEDKEETKC